MNIRDLGFHTDGTMEHDGLDGLDREIGIMDDLGGGGEGLTSLPTYTGFSQKLGWSSAWTVVLLHTSGLSLTGLLVLHWEANGSSSWGFNASVGSARCGSGGPGSCPVPQECVPQDGAAGAGLCRCPQGWAGPHCRMALCPENCNAHNGAGTCNQVQVV